MQRLLNVENIKIIKLKNNRNQHRSNVENLAIKITSLQLNVANLKKKVQNLKRIQNSIRQIAFDDFNAKNPTHYWNSRESAFRILNRDNTFSNPMSLHQSQAEVTSLTSRKHKYIELFTFYKNLIK